MTFIPVAGIKRLNGEHDTVSNSANGDSAPRVSQIHLFDTEYGTHLLAVNGSRVYRLDADVAAILEAAWRARDSERIDALLVRFGLDAAPYIDDEPVVSPPLRALSLAVAQKCNLGCSYCYAQQGEFGATPQSMTLGVAKRSVDLLLRDVQSGERVHLSFLGGEPLINRAVLYAATEYAYRIAEERGIVIGFAVTTNGTLLTEEDGEFFERYGFAVTVSVDGIGVAHDRQRAFKNGLGSYERLMARVRPLLAMQRSMQVSARVTVTPSNLDLRHTLNTLIAMHFHSVGFSPMLSSPNGREEMRAADLEEMLAQMIACGKEFERHVQEGRRYPFLNMLNALREIHRGAHRPYPCGAGAGYFGVSATGDLFACHRFVNDEAGSMGRVDTGVDHGRQNRWLSDRHVHRQEPCRSCWARYLCGGGCHHEVLRRGRPACDYIRGWLHYCLQAYARLSALQHHESVDWSAAGLQSAGAAALSGES